MIAEAIALDPKTPSKLSLDVGGFSGDYWILEVGKDYEYAVIGHPTRDYFWILSRTSTLDPPVTKGIVDRARAEHFDVSRLEYTRQSGAEAPGTTPDEPPVDPPEYGCAVGPHRSLGGLWWAPFAAGAAFVVRRRRRIRRVTETDC
jgi:MYXO-CTERM domain-containing protein